MTASVTRTPSRQLGTKLAIIIAITVALSLVVMMINLLAAEREERSLTAQAEIAQGWGGAQTLIGPAMVLTVRDKQNPSAANQYLVLPPKTLQIDAAFEAESRRRGLFSALVYQGPVTLQGEFLRPEGLDAGYQIIAAHLTFLLSDAKGLRQISRLALNDKALTPSLGGVSPNRGSQFHADVTAQKESPRWTLDLALDLRGSSQFRFTPFGDETRALIRSPWPHYSSVGATLPDLLRADEKGFQAEWTIRNFSGNAMLLSSAPDQAFRLDAALSAESAGARFFLPVDPYAQIDRALKYATLFIALTFLAFFLTEALTSATFHWIQYGLVGLALCLFYLLLLSISEQIGFGPAYGLAAVAVTLQVTLYSASAFKSWARSGLLFVLLALLYGVLYLILQMEDYALLAGSLLLFIALGVTMYVTRNLDWGRSANAAPS